MFRIRYQPKRVVDRQTRNGAVHMAEDLEEADKELEDDAESAEEWQAEAEKWKQKATEAEKAAAENSSAAQRLADLEKSQQDREDDYAQQLLAAAGLTEQQIEAARQEGAKTAAEWQAEAEKWKAHARKNEDLAKKNLAAATRLQKLEAQREAETAAATDKVTKAEAKAAETRADLEAKATQAELKAMRLAVAQELDVPAALIELLSGSSKREIEASADRLLRELAANKQPEVEALKAASAKAAAEQAAKAKEDGELAQARQLLVEAEVKALRLEIATDKQLPPGLADLLTGRTREQLDRQADALLTAVGGVKAERSTRSRMPTERLRSGALPEGAGEPDIDPGKLADSILRRNRGY